MQTDIPSISLYIHIPFCVKKCRYCDFYSEQYTTDIADEFVEALIVEWELVKEKYFLNDMPIVTLYFGGGTPSILSEAQWKRVAAGFIRTLNLSKNYEWSIECNPESFSEETAALWLDFGVTRVSIGVQSANEKELTILGRKHTARRALEVLNSAAVSRFGSVGADLMYGITGQTLQSLHASLDAVLSYSNVKHLSAYELTIADHTPFGIHRANLNLPDEDTVATMTCLVKETAAAKGFDQYEVSNYARKGHRCRHNEAYWMHRAYIGLGPGAHSYMPPRRFSNTKNVYSYIAGLKSRMLPVDFEETIDTAALAREIIFLRLRTAQGIHESDFRTMTGSNFASGRRMPFVQRFISRGMMEYSAPYWKLTDQGLLFADAIARDLL